MPVHYRFLLLLMMLVAMGCSESPDSGKTQAQAATTGDRQPEPASKPGPFTPTPQEVPLSQSLQHVDMSTEIPANFSNISSIYALVSPELEAWHAIFTDPDTTESIHIFSEDGFDRRPNNARRGTAKAVLNSTVKKYIDAGFALDPDVKAQITATINDFDYSNGMIQTLPFENEDNVKVYVRIRMLFTHKAVCITTTSTDADRFATMNKIADGISIK